MLSETFICIFTIVSFLGTDVADAAQYQITLSILSTRQVISPKTLSFCLYWPQLASTKRLPRKSLSNSHTYILCTRKIHRAHSPNTCFLPKLSMPNLKLIRFSIKNSTRFPLYFLRTTHQSFGDINSCFFAIYYIKLLMLYLLAIYYVYLLS